MKTYSRKNPKLKNEKSLGNTQTAKRMTPKPRKLLVKRPRKKMILMPNVLVPMVKRRKYRRVLKQQDISSPTQEKKTVQMADKGIQTDNIDQATETMEFYDVLENNACKSVKTEFQQENPTIETLNLQPSNTEDSKENTFAVEQVVHKVYKRRVKIENNDSDEDTKHVVKFKKERQRRRSIKSGKTVVAKNIVKSILEDFEVFDPEDKVRLHTAWDPVEKIYNCAHCDFTTTYLSSYKIHKDIHDNVKYECPGCLHKAASRGALLNHMRSRPLCKPHLEPKLREKKTRVPQKIFRCEQCGYECNTKQLLSDHKIIHLPKDQLPQFRCKYCSFVATRKNNFMRHQRLRHAEEIGFNLETLYCYHCDYNTKYKTNLIDHIKRHFKERKIYACAYCDLTYIYKMAYLQHEEAHKKEGQQYKCPHQGCNYWMPKKFMLKKHMVRHKNEHEVQLFHCPNCSHRTKYRSSFKTHLEKVCHISYADWKKEYENQNAEAKTDADDNEKKKSVNQAAQENTSEEEWEFSLSDQEI